MDLHEGNAFTGIPAAVMDLQVQCARSRPWKPNAPDVQLCWPNRAPGSVVDLFYLQSLNAPFSI